MVKLNEEGKSFGELVNLSENDLIPLTEHCKDVVELNGGIAKGILIEEFDKYEAANKELKAEDEPVEHYTVRFNNRLGKEMMSPTDMLQDLINKAEELKFEFTPEFCIWIGANYSVLRDSTQKAIESEAQKIAMGAIQRDLAEKDEAESAKVAN